MKIRNGFISNSSSSSFIISKRFLSEDMISKIKNHLEYAKNNFSQIEWTEPHDQWGVEETDEQIRLYASMDNFDMHEFLLLIGVEEDNIKDEFY